MISFFQNYPPLYQERAKKNLLKLIKIALDEDGKDLSAEGVFSPDHCSKAIIIAKENSFVVGLDLIELIFATLCEKGEKYSYTKEVEEGSRVPAMTLLCTLEAPTRILLKAERIILNFICHLSGVANLTYTYVEKLKGTGVTLLDTRKTTPGMRFLEKYAVTCAGASNHRLALDDMLMLKDNHIDALGSITKAVEFSRAHHKPCPPIEVECRSLEDVVEAASLNVSRIMLDNMSLETLKKALVLVPLHIEAEISGNISLDNIEEVAKVCPERKPDFISVGKITHSAPLADFSMRIDIHSNKNI